METKDILKKVDKLNIDSRFSLIVASYFCARVELGEITEENSSLKQPNLNVQEDSLEETNDWIDK